MRNPKISVILHTVRDNYPMLGLPDTWIFDPTIDSLAKQKFDDFELIIVDGLKGRGREVPDGRHWPSQPTRVLGFPESPWFDRGYLAISAPKNHAFEHCNGELVLQLDDCCEFDRDFLARHWASYKRGFCGVSLVDYKRGGETTIRDQRRNLLRRGFASVAGGFGYTSFPLRMALALNGYDEGFDGSKCSEDADFSQRLRLAGARYRMDHKMVVFENEHADVSQKAWENAAPKPKGDRCIKCNAVHHQIVKARHGKDRLESNRRQYTDAEWGMYGPPCRFYSGVAQGGPHSGRGVCSLAWLPCNWLKVPGDAESGSWLGEDPNWEHIRDWQPVFDLTQRWKDRRLLEGWDDKIPGT